MTIAKNRVALITGGSRGIGLGISQAMAKENWRLAVNGVRSENDVADVLDTLRKLGRDVIYCQGDVGVASDREAVIAKVVESFGALNLRATTLASHFRVSPIFWMRLKNRMIES